MREFKNTRIGDTVRVQFKTLEEGSERVQTFEGTLMKIRGAGVNQSITVRKMSFGVGVERIFPTHSPRFTGITSLRRGKVRRSKLYYLRDLSGKSHRVAYEKEAATARAPVSAKEAPPVATPAPVPASAPQ